MADSGAEVCARVDAHIFAETEAEAESLRAEADVAARLAIRARFEPAGDLPFPALGRLAFAEQAQINPYLFLRGLARRLGGGARVHEHSRVTGVEHGSPCVLRTERGTLRARWVIVATQIPTVPEGKFFARAFPHPHGVVAARTAGVAVPPGMWISAGEPTRSFRTARVAGQNWIVATGPGFRPGEGDAQDRGIAEIAGWIRDTFGLEPELGWTNEDFMPADGLPYVGAATGSTPSLLVATGFNAWGITNGVVAAHVLADTIEGRAHPLAAAYDATRLRPLRGATTFMSENAKAGFQMARDRILRSKVESLEAIGPGEAGIVRVDGRQVAVCRGADGRAAAVSAICTHLGCVVGWNALDRTWDCPCHGSRFTAEGEVLAGPAVAPLEPVDLAERRGQ